MSEVRGMAPGVPRWSGDPASPQTARALVATTRRQLVATGDEHLDGILGGGLERGLVHYIYGATRVKTALLLSIAVNAMRPPSAGGIGATRVVYVDCENRFNPYAVTASALTQNMTPARVLEGIMVSRAFNWNQVVEVLAEKVPQEPAGVLLVGGLTGLLDASSDGFGPEVFRDLTRIVHGIKQALARYRPLVVMTGDQHPRSPSKPVGGNILAHFASVLVAVTDAPRSRTYVLEQHPARPRHQAVAWLGTDATRRHPHHHGQAVMTPTPGRRSVTLDHFLAASQVPKPNLGGPGAIATRVRRHRRRRDPQRDLGDWLVAGPGDTLPEGGD